MKQTITVSVGISAYNEEKNISNVLKDVLAQKQQGWKLQEILVYSDGSSDNTVKNAQSVKSPFIKVIEDKSRKGKTARIQELFRAVKGDILIMFDADIKIPTQNVITDLVKAFWKDSLLMLAGGNPKPFPPKNFFQRGVYATFKVFYESRIQIRNGDNLFACIGQCLAIRNKFAKEIRFPKIKNEDTYLYFSCKIKGYKFGFVQTAVVYYKLPDTLSDYISQVFRSNPEAVQQNFPRYFGKLVFEEFNRGTRFYLRNVLKVFFSDPLPVTYIIIINLTCKPFFRFFSKSQDMTWNAIRSTK